MTEKKTLQQRTFEKLDSMQPGEYFNKMEFIKELYFGDYDYFLNQNFANMVNKVKNQLNETLVVKRKFRSIKGNFHRLT